MGRGSCYFYCASIFDENGGLEHVVTCGNIGELADVAAGRKVRIETRQYPSPEVVKEYGSDMNQKALGKSDFQHH